MLCFSRKLPYDEFYCIGDITIFNNGNEHHTEYIILIHGKTIYTAQVLSHSRKNSHTRENTISIRQVHNENVNPKRYESVYNENAESFREYA